MNIAIVLPYKENYSPKCAGAVSIHVSNLLNYSQYRSNIKIYGNTKSNKYLTKKFKNIKIKESVFSSSNKQYVQKFISLNSKQSPDLIEIHNRPSYIDLIKTNINSKIILYFHNDPLNLLGSRVLKRD